ncbi:hypothetical protein Psi02_42290 [Planotetraspora silvatica]|uniref:Suppressor of fused-like domain-containing protein n=1 Tax=Planotetraspora silvatica TaxID=234614 RepID=A0A8J3V0L9_9ACTN|nr:hypothetical protein Psi02_42290 [Planotetraspora silvatica]
MIFKHIRRFGRKLATSRNDVRSHYKIEWGTSDREAEFYTEDISIGVLKWNTSANTQGVNIYATVGASDYPIPGFSANHRQEFFVGLIPEFDDIASRLAWLGAYTQMTGEVLSTGHTYRALQGLVDGHGFGGFVILSPLDGHPAPVVLEDGRHVEFLMVIPVFSDELDYARSHGVDDLLAKMESLNVPFWDPTRNSTFRTPEEGSLLV